MTDDIVLSGGQGCRVYWGSHGCDLPSGHHLTPGPDQKCRCQCADDPPDDDDDEYANVGAYPYYGPDTRFYGEDAAHVMGPDHCLD